MRKSSVGSAVLGLLAVTVASIGATGVLMLLPFPNDRALFGCAGAITAVLYFGYGRWIGSRQSTKVAGLVMILAAAVQVLWWWFFTVQCRNGSWGSPGARCLLRRS